MYATHASTEFNLRFGATLRHLAQEIENALSGNLVALVLGGGYGRGEGGVVLKNGVEQAYNDLDLVLVIKRKLHLPWDRITSISGRYQNRLGIHVDFSRPLTISDIRHWPRALMWQDLFNGHIVLSGPADIIRVNAPADLTAALPSVEALRLLLNRGAGLLWALRVQRGAEKAPDDDFVRRNYFKCAMALGDALLIGYQRFISGYAQRESAFADLSRGNAAVRALGLQDLYASSLKFKFRPDSLPVLQPGAETLSEMGRAWGRVLLHTESKRTGREWPSFSRYCAWTGCRESSSVRPDQWLMNILRNRRIDRWSWRHPREYLYRTLPGLLGLTGAPASDWCGETERWLRIWHRFN